MTGRGRDTTGANLRSDSPLRRLRRTRQWRREILFQLRLSRHSTAPDHPDLEHLTHVVRLNSSKEQPLSSNTHGQSRLAVPLSNSDRDSFDSDRGALDHTLSTASCLLGAMSTDTDN